MILVSGSIGDSKFVAKRLRLITEAPREKKETHLQQLVRLIEIAIHCDAGRNFAPLSHIHVDEIFPFTKGVAI